MPTWYLGTIGFAYKAWRDLFYPPWLESRNYLATYSQCFNAVELDATFYGSPRPESVERWAAQTPADFQLSPKTPKTITHQFDLPQSTDEILVFIDRLRGLGSKLGPILLQWPPHFTARQLKALDQFLVALPKDVRYAVEFRHDSWAGNETAALLRQHQVAWVAVDYVHSPRQITTTTDFLYIRWLGDHGRFERGSSDRLDVTDDLVWWHEALAASFNGVERVYGFFNDDYAGHAPETCNQFKALLGLPTAYPQFPKQGTLF